MPGDRRERLTPQQCVGRLRDTRSRLEAALDGIDEDAASRNGWTAKEHLAHIAAWQRRLATWLTDDAAGRTPERPEPGYSFDQIDELNERNRLASHDAPLDEVRRVFSESFDDIARLILPLSADDLNAADRYEWIAGRPLLDVIASNGYGHYAEHIEMLDPSA